MFNHQAYGEMLLVERSAIEASTDQSWRATFAERYGRFLGMRSIQAMKAALSLLDRIADAPDRRRFLAHVAGEVGNIGKLVQSAALVIGGDLVPRDLVEAEAMMRVHAKASRAPDADG